MAGEYPPGFSFMGWHPMCICYTTNKLMSKNDFKAYLLTGHVKPSLYTQYAPQIAVRYVQKHVGKINKMKNAPYWMDNFTKTGKLKKSVSNLPVYDYEGDLT